MLPCLPDRCLADGFESFPVSPAAEPSRSLEHSVARGASMRARDIERVASSSTKRSESLAALRSAVSRAQVLLPTLLASSARRDRATAAEARAVRVQHSCLLASVVHGERYHGGDPGHNCEALDVAVLGAEPTLLSELDDGSTVHGHSGEDALNRQVYALAA